MIKNYKSGQDVLTRQVIGRAITVNRLLLTNKRSTFAILELKIYAP